MKLSYFPRILEKKFLCCSNMEGCLSNEVVSPLTSHGEGWQFRSSWRCPSHPALEKSTSLLLELWKERHPGMILNMSPSSLLMDQGNIGTSVAWQCNHCCCHALHEKKRPKHGRTAEKELLKVLGLNEIIVLNAEKENICLYLIRSWEIGECTSTSGVWFSRSSLTV